MGLPNLIIWAARLLPALWLAACVVGDPPVLEVADLAVAPELIGQFVPAEAAAGQRDNWLSVDRRDDGTYSFAYYGQTPEGRTAVQNGGDQVRLLRLADQRYLLITIYWSPLFEGHIFSFLEVAPSGEVRIYTLDFGRAAEDADFVALVRARHGLTLTFESALEDDSGVDRTRIEGATDAARLVAFFSDADVLGRLKTPLYKAMRPLR